MACRTSFARSALFVINLFVWLGGTAILGIGAWIVSELNGYETEAPGQAFVSGIAVAAIVIGISVSIIGIVGCCGACKESVCCLKLYIVLLSVTIILELVVGVFSIIFSNKIEEKLEEKLLEYVMGYNLSPEATTNVDRMQYGLQCCGASGPSDYEQNGNISASMYEVPVTCCNPGVACTLMAASDTVYQTGCAEKMAEYAAEYLGVIVGVCFAVIVCQVISLVFAFCLIRSIEDAIKV